MTLKIHGSPPKMPGSQYGLEVKRKGVSYLPCTSHLKGEFFRGEPVNRGGGGRNHCLLTPRGINSKYKHHPHVSCQTSQHEREPAPSLIASSQGWSYEGQWHKLNTCLSPQINRLAALRKKERARLQSEGGSRSDKHGSALASPRR